LQLTNSRALIVHFTSVIFASIRKARDSRDLTSQQLVYYEKVVDCGVSQHLAVARRL
jgi:hypothetical protein